MRNWVLSIERWTSGANEVFNEWGERLRRWFGALLPCAGACCGRFASKPVPAGIACRPL